MGVRGADAGPALRASDNRKASDRVCACAPQLCANALLVEKNDVKRCFVIGRIPSALIVIFDNCSTSDDS